jgi:hypothetical protein
MTMNRDMMAILVIVLIVALILIGPIITIWALNTLFPALAIPYTFYTWLAVVILGAVFSPTIRVTRK